MLFGPLIQGFSAFVSSFHLFPAGINNPQNGFEQELVQKDH
jgi:hypothetical protein